ncbi:MAG: hypothetical protein A2Y38_17010 [Spirochaetes bacterium GWB1_59_5]|nr:MAG: hypothetical protein A2Y38_17010 [Spirochaetes bacterium GWB1_59_5]
MEEKDTIRELAREALQVQSACNPSGVLRSWMRAMTTLQSLSSNSGTTWLRQHPVMVAYADKMASLCGVQSLSSDSAIWSAFKQLEQMVSE